jgi:hypothetical protein
MAKMRKEAAQEPVTVDPTKFKKLVKNIEAAKGRTDDARGELGNLYKHGEDTLGINRGALKLTVKVKNMDETKREDFLRCFEEYLGLLDIGRQDDLFDESGFVGKPGAPTLVPDSQTDPRRIGAKATQN